MSCLRQVAFVLVAVLPLGCAGVTIAEHPMVDFPMPRAFTGRTVFADSAALHDDLPGFVGHLVYIYGDGRTEVVGKRLVVAGYRPALTPVKDGLLWESKLTADYLADARISYVATLNDVKAKQMLEVILQDVAVSRLDDNNVDWDGLYAIAETPKPEAVSRRCFVQQARLATLAYRTFFEVSDEEKVAAGDVFQAGESTYNSSGRRSIDFRVSMACLDVDALMMSANLDKAQLAPDELEKILAYFRTAIGHGKDGEPQLVHSEIEPQVLKEVRVIP